MEEEITLDLREFFDILRKRLRLIISITVIATLISAIISFYVIDPVYEAKTSIVVGKSAEKKYEGYNSSDVAMYQKLITTYAAIAKSGDVAETAAQKLDIDITAKQLRAVTKVTPQSNTQIIDIKIESKNPENAKKMVDALTEAFMEAAKKIYPTGNVEIMDSAKVPSSPIKPKKALNVAIAFFLGLMVSIGLVFLLEYMDNTIKTESDVEKYLDIPVIGMIPDHTAE